MDLIIRNIVHNFEESKGKHNTFFLVCKTNISKVFCCQQCNEEQQNTIFWSVKPSFTKFMVVSTVLSIEEQQNTIFWSVKPMFTNFIMVINVMKSNRIQFFWSAQPIFTKCLQAYIILMAIFRIQKEKKRSFLVYQTNKYDE